MPELQRLHDRHASSVLAFELTNRAYFARSISDRGDEFFDNFAQLFRTRLDEQRAGENALYVLVAEDGSVLGRFNLFFDDDTTAKLGYRVAEHAAGHGVATANVRHLCELAATEHGLRVVRAATSDANAASRAVLLKAGFVAVGPAGPADLGGKQGTWFRRDVGGS